MRITTKPVTSNIRIFYRKPSLGTGMQHTKSTQCGQFFTQLSEIRDKVAEAL